ncbi:MAG: hypothetical protein ACK5MG_04930 [Bacteroidales bacterium]
MKEDGKMYLYCDLLRNVKMHVSAFGKALLVFATMNLIELLSFVLHNKVTHFVYDDGAFVLNGIAAGGTIKERLWLIVGVYIAFMVYNIRKDAK